MIQKLERTMGIARADVTDQQRRGGAILNALELMVEEDEPPREPRETRVLRLLADALLAQAAVAGLKASKLSTSLDQLVSHAGESTSR